MSENHDFSIGKNNVDITTNKTTGKTNQFIWAPVARSSFQRRT